MVGERCLSKVATPGLAGKRTDFPEGEITALVEFDKWQFQAPVGNEIGSIPLLGEPLPVRDPQGVINLVCPLGIANGGGPLLEDFQPLNDCGGVLGLKNSGFGIVRFQKSVPL